MTSHIAEETAKVVTLAPAVDHGETIVSPRPEPRSMRMKVRVEAAKAPAITGAQLTADEDDSTGASTSAVRTVEAIISLLAHEQRKKDDDWNRYPEQPE